MAEFGVRPFNARSLVLSVLLGLPRPRLATPELMRLADLFGIPQGTMRTALSRMVAAGELSAADGIFTLHGDRLIARKQAQDIGRRPPAAAWDGSWWVVTVLAPARTLAARRDFRAAMVNARMGELRPDTWLRPANLQAPAAVDSAVVVRGPLTGAESEQLVARLWDIDAIAARGGELLAALDDAASALARRGADGVPAAMLAAAAVVRFLRAEPMLPPSLVPPGWPADELRVRYRRFDTDLGRALGEALREGGTRGQPPLP